MMIESEDISNVVVERYDYTLPKYVRKLLRSNDEATIAERLGITPDLLHHEATRDRLHNTREQGVWIASVR